jgi:hypothetical protein
MTDSRDQLVQLVATEPLLSPVLRSHLEDNHDEILQTILLAEVMNWIVDHRHDRPDVGSRVLAWLNDAREVAREGDKIRRRAVS